MQLLNVNFPKIEKKKKIVMPSGQDDLQAFKSSATAQVSYCSSLMISTAPGEWQEPGHGPALRGES